jgi:hypothetical protein
LCLILAGCGSSTVDPTAVDPLESLRASLRQTVSIDWQEKPLDEALEELSERYGIRIEIDRPGLQDSGVQGNVKVSLRVRDIQLKSALQLALDEFGLSYIWREQGIEITSWDKAHEELTWRVYPTADVAFDESQTSELADIVVGDDATLPRWISDLIAPESWSGQGGPGRCVMHPGSLWIQQRRDVHEQIEEFFEQLRWLAEPELQRGTAAQRITLPPPDLWATPAEQAIYKALDQPVSIDLSRPPKETLRELSARLNINIVYDQRGLEDVAADKHLDIGSPYDIDKGESLVDVPFRLALDLLLSTVDHQCSWTVRHETLLITNRDQTKARLIRPYRVRGSDYMLLGHWDLTETDASGVKLLDDLADSLDPDSWERQGGPGRGITTQDGFIVAQRLDVHERIRNLLEQLDRGLDPHVVNYDEREASPDARRLLDLLEQPAAADYSDGKRTLSEILKDLQTRFRLPNVYFDKESLADIGVLPKEHHPRLRVKNIALAALLNLLLEPLELDWHVRDNVLIITSRMRPDAERHLTTSVYRAPSLIDDPGRCVDLVSEHIEPESWEIKGGPGTIHWVSGVLVVSQSMNRHREVRRVLRQIDSFFDAPPDATFQLAYTSAERRVLEALDRPITYRCKQQHLQQAVAEVARLAGIENVEYDRAVRDNLDGAWHVTADVSGEPAAEVLTDLLKSHSLGWAIHDEVLWITTKGADDAMICSFCHVPAGILTALRSAYPKMDGDWQRIEERLYPLLMAEIEPSTWMENGGHGKLDVLPLPDGKSFGLVISQSPAVHREVRKFLADAPQLRKLLNELKLNEDEAKP